MPRLSPLPTACSLLCLLLPLRLVAGPEEPWVDLTQLRFREAADKFAGQAETPASLIGRSLALLNRQPRTDDNIEEAARLLRRAAESAGPHEAAAAGYYLGCISQYQLAEPDPARARTQFAAVAARWPEEFFGQLAAVRHAALALYSGQPDPALFAVLTEEAERCTDRAIRRSYHLLLGEAAQRFHQGDDFAYRHYAAAWDLDIALPEQRANILLRLGRLAEKLQRPGEAGRHYGRFLQENPRDDRTSEIAARLAALQEKR
jgi:hypothetical protein